MVNYKNGKNYEIEPITGGAEGDIYVGSTAKKRLSLRMSGHTSGYEIWKDGRLGKVSSFELFDGYGVENCHTVLLELVNVKSKDELFAREKYRYSNATVRE